MVYFEIIFSKRQIRRRLEKENCFDKKRIRGDKILENKIFIKINRNRKKSNTKNKFK
jgi:hypothetical protein